MNVMTNAEKEWLRKMNGGKPVRKETEPAPVRAEVAQQESKPVKNEGRGFRDVAGMDDLKRLVIEGFINVLNNRECAKAFGVTPPSLLFYGPAGCGKTFFAEKIAEEVGVNFMKVVPDDIASTLVHGTQEKVADVFRRAAKSAPTLIFFDEFEALAPRRGGGSTIMNRIVPELLSQMDGFQKAEGLLVLLASTNRPWDLDSAVLRPPRMTERIYVGLPDFAARHYMVKKALDPLPKREAPDYDRIAEALEGFNCADITAFVEKVKEAPIRRGLASGTTEEYITADDVEAALAASHSSVQQSDLEAFSKWEASQR